MAKTKNTNKLDVMYILSNLSEQRFLSYGITFQEFTEAVPKPLNHLLLLQHEYNDGIFHLHTLLNYVEKDNIPKLAQCDVRSYGNFCWVDFESIETLNTLTPQEIGHLLYLGHHKKPIQSPFNEKLNNRYAYLAHEDGSYNQLYCQSIHDYMTILEDVFHQKLSQLPTPRLSLFNKKPVYKPLSPNVLEHLVKTSEEGLLYDFENVNRTRQKTEVPIYTIGQFENMNPIIQELKLLKRNALSKGKLVYHHKAKHWDLLT